jgi:hypothetical protein
MTQGAPNEGEIGKRQGIQRETGEKASERKIKVKLHKSLSFTLDTGAYISF